MNEEFTPNMVKVGGSMGETHKGKKIRDTSHHNGDIT